MRIYQIFWKCKFYLTIATLVTEITIFNDVVAKLIWAEVEEEAEEWENERENDEKYLGANIGRSEKPVTIFLLYGSLFERHGRSPTFVFGLKILFLLAGQYDGNPAIQGFRRRFPNRARPYWNNLDATSTIVLNFSNV